MTTKLSPKGRMKSFVYLREDHLVDNAWISMPLTEPLQVQLAEFLDKGHSLISWKIVSRRSLKDRQLLLHSVGVLLYE